MSKCDRCGKQWHVSPCIGCTHDGTDNCGKPAYCPTLPCDCGEGWRVEKNGSKGWYASLDGGGKAYICSDGQMRKWHDGATHDNVYHPTQAEAQAALDKYLGKEKQVSQVICEKAGECKDKGGCDHCEPHAHSGSECGQGAGKSCWYRKCIPVTQKGAEIPYTDLKVGEYRIEPKDALGTLQKGIHTIVYLRSNNDAFSTDPEKPPKGDSRCCFEWSTHCYKFYETGTAVEAATPQTKETDDMSMEIKLFATAIVQRAEPKEGEKLGKIIGIKDGSYKTNYAEDRQTAIENRVNADAKLKTHDVIGKTVKWDTL